MYYNFDRDKYVFDKTYREYEIEIRNTPLFSLNKETEYSAYSRESQKLVLNLYNYVVTINNSYIDYADSIVTTAKKCIESYDPEKGEFINYFNTSWSEAKKHIAYEQFKDAYSGVTFTQSEALAISKFKKLMKQLGNEDGAEYSAESLSSDIENRISKIMGIPLGRIRKYRWIVANVTVYDQIGKEDGTASTIEYEQGSGNISSERHRENRPEDIFINNSKHMEYYDLLEDYYLQKQERQKFLLRMLITSEIFRSISDDGALIEIFKQYKFFDKDTLNVCIKQQSSMTQRQIAESINRTEASVSRSWSDFKDGLQKWIKEKI